MKENKKAPSKKENNNTVNSYISKIANRKKKSKVSEKQVIKGTNINVDFDKLDKETKRKLLIASISILVAFISLIVILIVMITPNSSYNKLICESDQGSITIIYDDKDLKDYKNKGIDYDFESHKNLAKEVGVNKYITDFMQWFGNNTTGECNIK